MNFLPTGDGWTFGADGGPINSTEHFNTSFSTGSMGGAGGGSNAWGAMALLGGLITGGVLVWFLSK